MTAVLVVDDSLTVRMDLVESLEAAGLTAIGCATLAEARAALAAHEIDIAVLDVRLPDGDGIAFIDELRAEPSRAELPILVLSSEAEIGDRIRGMRTGASDYVGKPYDIEFVIARIRELAATRAATARPLVLVIDDSPTLRAALGAELTAAGFDVAEAASGRDGLRVAAARRPAAVIIDHMMPDLTGELVIRRLRLDPALRATPCLLLTGSDHAFAEVQALDAGADAFARKEADVSIILARLAAMLRTAGADAREVTAGSIGPKRILAIDSDASYVEALAECLRQDGYDVAGASTGEEAIELLAVQRVDCVMIELGLPGGSGIDICRRIRAAPGLHDTPVVIVSARDDRAATIEALAAGADDVVVKTTAKDVLSARVQAQIRRKSVGDEQRTARERLTRAAMSEQLEARNVELAAANRELEAFSYSVSHDLRAPLRTIERFSAALAEELAGQLGEEHRGHLARIVAATTRMSDLIDALLDLARLSRVPLHPTTIDVTTMSAAVVDELRRREPDRQVDVAIAPALTLVGDPRLTRVIFDNLIGNAWKFTARTANARVEVGRDADAVFVRDNGAGFDMVSAHRLFTAFERLHRQDDFRGTGVGLATVRRIVERHGGRIWFDSSPGAGATFHVTLGPS